MLSCKADGRRRTSIVSGGWPKVCSMTLTRWSAWAAQMLLMLSSDTLTIARAKTSNEKLAEGVLDA